MTLPCLILAAGFGTRMGALTKKRPKPLLRVAGKTLLDHAIDCAQTAGAGPICVNAHYRAEQIQAHLHDRKIDIQHETPEILDSGGAVKAAATGLPPGPMLTLNADAVWSLPDPLGPLIAAFDPARMGALLLLVPIAQAHAHGAGGDFAMNRAGRLTLDKTAGAFVYTGAQVIDPRLCQADPRSVFSLRDIWGRLEREERLFGLIYPGDWVDVGHPGGLRRAAQILRPVDV